MAQPTPTDHSSNSAAPLGMAAVVHWLLVSHDYSWLACIKKGLQVIHGSNFDFVKN
jgi:hypothetical protein